MIVISDLHLVKTNDTILRASGLSSRQIDIWARLMEALAAAAREPDKTLVLAGDVFDRSNPIPPYSEILREFFRLAAKSHVTVYVLPGNHDSDMNWNAIQVWSDVFPMVTVVQQPTVIKTAQGRSVLFLPHVPPSRYIDKYKTYDRYVQKLVDVERRFLYIIGHCHPKGAVNSSDIELEAGNAIPFDMAKYKFDIGVFGHIHLHQVLRNKVVCSGSIVTQSFDEANNPKGMVLLHGKEWKFSPYKYPETPYKTVRIDLVSRDSITFNRAKIESLVKDHILKIRVYARSADQVDEVAIRKAFGEFGTVARFETIVTKDIKRVDADDPSVEDVFESVDYEPVFEAWLKSSVTLKPKEISDAMVAFKKVSSEVFSEED